MNERTCESIAELISAYVDNEVTTEERTLVQTHLGDCHLCAVRLADYLKLQEGLCQYLMPSSVASFEQAGAARSSASRNGSVIRYPVARAKLLSIPRLAGAAVAVAVILVLITIAGSYLGGRSQLVPAVQAQEILEKAAKVANDPAASGIRTLEMTSTYWSKRVEQRFGSVGTEMRSERHLWWQAPNRWRSEFRQTAPPDQVMAQPNISVSDGQSVWDSYVGDQGVTINAWEPQMDVLKSLSALGSIKGGQTGGAEGDLASLLQHARQCYDPQLLGEESVAERPTYVVDLGPTKCPSASAASMNGRRIIWVDRETFFELKSEQYGVEPGQGLIMTNEVTNIHFNGSIDPQLFTFTPPPGAKVHDNRPKPAPSADQFQQQMEQVAEQVDFPVFIPQRVPQGLKPRQPRIDPMLGVQLAYVPAGEVEKSSLASRDGIEITEQRATYDLVARWTERAETVNIGSAKGWLRRGMRNADGTGSDSAALILRDGTLVSANSFTVPPEELINVVSSLEPVAGSKPPLPNPAPMGFAEIRTKASFKVFVPTYVPAGLGIETPVPTQRQGTDRVTSVVMNFHTSDGAKALRFVESAAEGHDSVQSPLQNAPEVTIGDGMIGHLYETRTPPPSGTRVLWWIQDDTYLSLETQVLSKEDLLKVAASMSATADLGQTETPVSRPTPTPIPMPKFTILRPTWLPEKMTVREQYLPGMPEYGSSVMLGFDPRPEDTQPHNVLTLREMPKAQVGRRGVPDPQETHEVIGGRDVTIVSRGDAWITLSWEDGDVALVLTNPYYPPGHPKYSHDELRKVVESIR